MKRVFWYAAAVGVFVSSVLAKPVHAATGVYAVSGNSCGNVGSLLSDLIGGSNCNSSGGLTISNGKISLGNGSSLNCGNLADLLLGGGNSNCPTGNGSLFGGNSNCLPGSGSVSGNGSSCLPGSGFTSDNNCLPGIGSLWGNDCPTGNGGQQDVEWFPGQGPNAGTQTPQTPECPQTPQTPECPQTPQTPECPQTPQLPGGQRPGTPGSNSGPGNSNQGNNNQGNNNQGNTNQGNTNQGGSSQGSTSTSSYITRIVELVNAERAAVGLSPVRESSAISSAAAIRARETMTSFSHTRPSGSNFSTVLDQNNISYRGAGENIAYGYDTPEQVMNAWMNSPGHRANILNANFTTIGVGYYQGSNGVKYWTQLFTY